MTTFVEIIDRPETMTIDGYSSAKTLNGVMHDIARLMKDIFPREIQTFMTKGKQEAIDLLDCTPNPDKPEKILQFLHISSTIKKNVGGCVHVTYR